MLFQKADAFQSIAVNEGDVLSCVRTRKDQRKRHREGAVCRAPARQIRPSLCTYPGRIAARSEHLNLDPEQSKNVPIFAPLGSA